jgi:carboxypeptidase Taq
MWHYSVLAEVCSVGTSRLICPPKVRLIEPNSWDWIKAREDADFAAFLPWLEKMIGLKREEAQAVGYGKGVPYDALLDDYEPGMTAAEIERVFSPLRDELVKLVSAIQHSSRRPNVEILSRHYPKTPQVVLAEGASKAIGFDFDAGRVDESAHPFCSGFGPGDCRLTTRYNDHHFNSAFFGVMHESGHGIYDQGLPEDSFGLGIGQATSLGIHESQSRLWENFVGRSRAFWKYLFPTAQIAFPKALADVSLDDFYFAVNDVRPSLIRVEADEVTYNLHIMLRFEIEEQLIAGDLKPADVPAAWNDKVTKYFGLAVPTDANGCLQDIHWSAGLFGYFPTYALGNMYAAQFFIAARRDLGDLDDQFSRGIFKPLKGWLNDKIHRHGKRYSAKRLVEVVTGETLSHQPLITHLRAKYSELYGL